MLWDLASWFSGAPLGWVALFWSIQNLLGRLFNYESASGKFTADSSSHSDCGHSCHVAVKAKDHIFHPYQNR